QKIQIDASGNVYVAGTTESSDFPTTFGAYQETYQGNNGYWGGDAFIAKLSPDLSTIIAATLLGGSGSEEGNDLILDDNGDLYLSGITGSANFPVISGYDQGYNGGYGNFASDAFLAKFDGNLQTLIASTFLGGVRNENGGYISIDLDRNIFVTGITGSDNFPFTTGAYDSTFSNSIGDVFISKFDQTLSSLMASTFLGGNDTDWGYAVLNDADGNVFVTGHMSSIDYPTTPGAYDRTYNASCGYMQNCADVAISKLNGNLTELLASTYLGGNSWDSGTDLCLGSDGRIYVGGFTHSTEYFPTAGSIYSQDYLGGSADLFVACFDVNLTTLYHSTYFGGDGTDIGTICLNAENDIYFVAVTGSQDIPTSDNAIQPIYAGGEYDVYVAKYTTNLFSRVTNGDIVNDGGKSVAVSWGDYDNDGYDDLFVSNFGYPIPQNNCLYHNQGNGTFSKIDGVSITNDNTFSAGSCWGDYDNDNDLDIFVGTSQNGLNLLYENNGDGTFTQILNTDIVNDPAYSLNSSWLDYNNDGLLDLIVSNENDNNPPNYTASNFLYRNDDTSFIQQSTGTLV
ncbi:MAG: VCBS repeat-containing protein, partial [candidate division Zixibacteria bacterium]|nr:VCBS repeat-containing protein [candidate division Zixibacteria bacterium]